MSEKQITITVTPEDSWDGDNKAVRVKVLDGNSYSSDVIASVSTNGAINPTVVGATLAPVIERQIIAMVAEALPQAVTSAAATAARRKAESVAYEARKKMEAEHATALEAARSELEALRERVADLINPPANEEPTAATGTEG